MGARALMTEAWDGRPDGDILDAYSETVAATVERARDAVVFVAVSGRQQQGSGSGFVFTPDGYVLTNSHVVRGAVALEVSRPDGTRGQAELVGDDPDSDLSAKDRFGKRRRRLQNPHVIRRLEADVFPALGSKPIADITAPQLLAMAKKIEARGAKDIARRCWQTCGQVFEYAVAHGAIERNPSRDVKPSVALKPRDKQHFARVEAKELPELLRKIEAYPGSPFTRFAMQLMALTFVRTGELIGARWDEFDLDAAEWRIPASRMKMPTPHIVPLAKQTVDLLRCLHELRGLSGLLFPGERDHEQSMSNGTILGALRRMGYAGRMTGHGFRGVASTALHEMGFDHAHIELQLAHMERDEVSAAYNFATYLPARRKMMQAWADRLDKLRTGAKVVPLRAA